MFFIVLNHTPPAMVKNYFKIALRSLRRNKGYSIINIGGLAVGMAVAILIGLWIYDELSFDKYNKNYDRVAQIMQHQTFNGYKGTENSIPMPLVTELKNKYGSNFKYLVMASWQGKFILSYGDKKLSIEGNYMDVDAAKMLSLRMLKGTDNGLKDPHSILISASTAKAIFGDEDPMNKSIKIANKLDVKVTGVYEDID